MSGDEAVKKALYVELLNAIRTVRPDLLSSIRRIVEYVRDRCGMQQCKFTALDVSVLPDRLKELAKLGLLDKDGEYTYVLKDPVIVVSVMEELDILPRPKPKGPAFNITPSLFDGIVGYDTVKRTLVMALRAKAPVHVLLIGPPGVGKSLFLDSIVSALESNKDCFAQVEGGKGLTTSAGLVEVLLQLPPQTPCVLIIDELDKMNRNDIAVLHRLMVTGEVLVAKHRMYVREKRNVWVIAAANTDKRIPEQILSRFLVVRFRSLSEEEYKKIIPPMLVKREGIPEDLAEYIALKLAPITRDPRDAIRVSRMAYSKEEVDYIVDLMNKQQGPSTQD